MDRKKMIPLERKLTLLIILTAVILSLGSIGLGYYICRDTIESHFIERGQSLVNTTAKFVEPDRMEQYLTASPAGAGRYEENLALLAAVKEDNAMRQLYVIKPTPDGVYYIYDTDGATNSRSIVYFLEWADTVFLASASDMLKGELLAPIKHQDDSGRLLSVYAPLYGPEETVQGYMGAVFSWEPIMVDSQQFLFRLAGPIVLLALMLVAVYLYLLRKTVIYPLNAVAKAATAFLSERVESLEGPPRHDFPSATETLAVHTRDELETLANALIAMEKKMDDYILNLDLATKKAETDHLTGLENRVSFQKRVNAYLRTKMQEGQMDAFIMIDIDNFKQVNDNYGHLVGDEVLQKCAEALKSIFRSSDLVARLGGDEIAVFCKQVGGVETVTEKARRMKEAWSKLPLNAGDLSITASIGICLVEDTTVTYLDLYQQADAAMYQAKKQGRDRYVIHTFKPALML